MTKPYFDRINFQAKLQETLVLLISAESVGLKIICDFQYRNTPTEYSMKGSALLLWK